jgi:hypothetical protein
VEDEDGYWSLVRFRENIHINHVGHVGGWFQFSRIYFSFIGYSQRDFQFHNTFFNTVASYQKSLETKK